MVIQDVEISLDSEYATYYPGQTIHGKIEYTLDSLKKIRGICVKFKGIASTSITKTEQYKVGDTTHTRTIVCTGDEEYFHLSYYILGSPNGPAIEIPAGKNVYPFTCDLPFNLPSSFEGDLGFVRYTIKVTLDRPAKFDQDTLMAFTIVSDLDLNSGPEYCKPVHIQIEKSLGCWCCKTGSVSLDVRMPVSGYCPGQSIPLDVICENNSSTHLLDIKIRLRKIVTFRTHTPSVETEVRKVDLADLSLGQVKKHMSLNWQPLFKIPPLPPSNLLHCSIIDVRYEIKVVCSPDGCHADADETAPVYLGTIPLVGFQLPSPPPESSTVAENNVPLLLNVSLPTPGYPYPVPDSSTTPSAPQPEAFYPVYPNQNVTSRPPPPGYDSPGQPSYQESQFTAKSICGPEDNANIRIHGRPDFAPRYPTYGFVLPEK